MLIVSYAYDTRVLYKEYAPGRLDLQEAAAMIYVYDIFSFYEERYDTTATLRNFSV